MSFSKIDALRYGFEKTKKDPVTIIGISLVLAIYWTIPFYIINFFFSVNKFIGIIFLLFTLCINLLMLMGYIKVLLEVYNGNKVSLKDLFYHYQKFPDFLIGILFFIFLLSVGFIFLILPAIYFGVRFSFSFFNILQGRGSALTSFKSSWTLTKKEFFNLLLLYIFLVFLNFLGFLFFIVGLAFTLPVSFLSVVYAYKEINKSYRKREIQGI